MARSSYPNYPKRARFTEGREKFPAVKVDFTLANGSRAQRRLLQRLLRQQQKGKK